jgi:hypothetical protein
LLRSRCRGGEQISVVFDQRCKEASVIERLETSPPAALFGAPRTRLQSIVKNPETLKKLMI